MVDLTPTFPIYKINMSIKGEHAVVNVCGDLHYGVKGVTKELITEYLNEEADKNRGNIFRVFTGDLVENQLKTSVGHNYDIAIPDPAIQKDDMIDILKQTNKYLYGDKVWKNLNIKPVKGIYNNLLSVGVEGNHELRTRKTTGQWLSQEIFKDAKIFWGRIQCILELTITNPKLKMSKTYNLFLAHRGSKTDAASEEGILRSFRKKQASYPGVDVIIFGHSHKEFLMSSGYFDTKNGKFNKVLYVVNPSPMQGAEYSDEAGYPLLKNGMGVNFYLPLNDHPWAKI